MSVSYCKPLSGQHSSSSDSIAHWMLQDYPPKVQPRSSAARHGVSFKDLMAVKPIRLDTVDKEASYILVALANHDLTPTDPDLSLKNSIIVERTAEQEAELTPSCGRCSSTTSTSSSGSGNSMSISNLLGNDESPLSPALTSVSLLTLRHLGREKGVWNLILGNSFLAESPIERRQLSHQQDPIMLLAAAAAIISKEEQQQQEEEEEPEKPEGKEKNACYQKRKFHSDSFSVKNSFTARYPHEGQEPERLWQKHENETNRQETRPFSLQYMSMRQNPKIKRNAMHAYITYMIYSDMANKRSAHHVSYNEFYKKQKTKNRLISSPSIGSHVREEEAASRTYPSQTHHKEEISAVNSATTSLFPRDGENGTKDNYSSRHQYASEYWSSVPPTSSIIARPLTAYLWDDASDRQRPEMILPPLTAYPSPL
ncbi:hypothetical protein EC973_003781 [Apophysomyces ossiformis]|uniref:Uncharacterized protein n=1 Tax=Apophysomyces ossiformis TaxID=679940 RepID=A0A8H7BKZ5_9FUNG|nr:hypothetical protein EC973_003781 [Apophysomyces ossiformis]